MSLLLSLLALLSNINPLAQEVSRPPTLNLSAVRPLICDEGTGSGFMIGDNILATANHVAVLHNCRDVVTGTKFTTYKTDAAHDFALMTGEFPKIPYVKYSCDGYKNKRDYSAYGHSAHGQPYYIFRQEIVRATKHFTPADMIVDDMPMPGMRVLYGFPVPGMSGGPVTDQYGTAFGIVNAGDGKGNFFSYELKDTILCKA
jgi:hypothetical protein